jgi:HEAT repeat protein
LRMQAAFTLAQRRLEVNKLMPLFVEGLKHKSSGVRLQAVQGLSMLGNTGGGAAAALAETLRDPDANIRQQVVYALQNVRGSPEVVVPILLDVYQKGDAGARRTVLQVSWMYGGKAKDLIADGLKDKDASVRQQAVYALQNVQGNLVDMLPLLASLTKDKDINIRQQIVWMIARTGEAGIPHLAELLKDPEANIRMQAVQQLRNHGPKAVEKALPAIKEAVKDSNPNVRMTAMQLLAMSKEGPDYLAQQFSEEKDAGVRASIIQALMSVRGNKLSLSLIKPAMKDPSPQVRQMTINMLGNLGNQSAEGFEAFEMGLKDSDNQVSISAAYMGSFYGTKSWTPLEETLKSTKNAGFRQAALQTLQQTNYRSKTGVPALSDCLKDDNAQVRLFACNLLGSIGPDAADALPRLRELTEDSNVAVQQAARNAVQRIAKN